MIELAVGIGFVLGFSSGFLFAKWRDCVHEITSN